MQSYVMPKSCRQFTERPIGKAPVRGLLWRRTPFLWSAPSRIAGRFGRGGTCPSAEGAFSGLGGVRRSDGAGRATATSRLRKAVTGHRTQRPGDLLGVRHPALRDALGAEGLVPSSRARLAARGRSEK